MTGLCLVGNLRFPLVRVLDMSNVCRRSMCVCVFVGLSILLTEDFRDVCVRRKKWSTVRPMHNANGVDIFEHNDYRQNMEVAHMSPYIWLRQSFKNRHIEAK